MKNFLQGLGGPLRGGNTVQLVLLTITATTLLVLTGCSQKSATMNNQTASTVTQPLTSFYDLSATTIDGQEQSMAAYKGKYILVVNVASHCGFTPQYKELEELYKKYSSILVVLGFPANNFLWQESGSNEEIKTFCSLKYQVTFPMFAKISVKGKTMSPVYQWLTDPARNGWNKEKPSWNFNKYLIGPDGTLLAHFGSKVLPLSPDITNYLK